MRKHYKKFNISILIILILFTFSLVFVFSKIDKVKNSPTPPLSVIEKTGSVTMIAGDETTHLSFAEGSSFYDILLQAQNSGSITFSGKNYPGLGFFITDIGTLHSGGGKDLLYYINGKEASVGVSNYILRDGDIIEWKLE